MFVHWGVCHVSPKFDGGWIRTHEGLSQQFCRLPCLTTSLPHVLVRQRDPHYSSDRSETLKDRDQAYSWQNLLLLLWMKTNAEPKALAPSSYGPAESRHLPIQPCHATLSLLMMWSNGSKSASETKGTSLFGRTLIGDITGSNRTVPARGRFIVAGSIPNCFRYEMSRVHSCRLRS